MRSVVTLTTAPAGSGKSYRRCAWFLAEQWLPSPGGVHWSNFPICFEKLEAFVAAKHGIMPDVVRDRVKVIPSHVLKAWQEGRSGPWEFFAGVSLDGAHIAIDEIHNYCGKESKREIKQKWKAWAGELRHQGCTVEVISQHPRKIAQELKDEAACRIRLVNSELRRDPWFGIPLSDWYELRAKYLTGKYSACVWEIEERLVLDTWTEERCSPFWLDPQYFPLYNSFSAPHQGGVASAGLRREFEVRGGLSLALWFIRRNLLRVLSRAAIIVVVIFLMTGGGGRLFTGLFAFFSRSVATAKAEATGRAPRAASPSAVPLRPRGSATVKRASSSPVSSSQPSGPLASQPSEADKRLAELQEQVRRSSAVVLLTPESLVLRNGYEFRIGDVVDVGEWKGERVSRINWGRRVVEFESGRVLRLREVVE